MKYFVLSLFVLLSSVSFAQTDSAKAPVYGWTHGMVAGLTLSQIAFTDWTQGGDNALSWALSIDGKSLNDQEKTNWSSTYKVAFGQARLGDAGLRKTEDKIELESVITYKLNAYVNPYGAVSFKSQFAKGYKYPAGVETAVSKIFDPAYLTQSVGAGWQPITEVKTRLGVALREIVADAFAVLYTDDPSTTTKLEKSKIDGGLESVTDVEWKLAENILFTSKLELFAPLKRIDRVDVRGESKVTMSVNKYISAMLSVQVLNIEPFPRTQVKESISLGFTYNVF